MCSEQVSSDNAFKSIYLNIVIDEDPITQAAIDYALYFCDAQKAHLTVDLTTTIIDMPSGYLLPAIDEALRVLNDERRKKAAHVQQQIELAAQLSGIAIDCHVVRAAYAQIRDRFVMTARLSDLCVLSMPDGILPTKNDILEDILFGSGRPVIVVPTQFVRQPSLKHTAVAWDGSREAARAIGDAIPLLKDAHTIEILCVESDQSEQGGAGTDLARRLGRHCSGALKLVELPLTESDAGSILRAHLEAAAPDLLVMGAYGHSRFREFLLGGVTRTLLRDSKVPLFCSH